jgi:hypothetical protein
LFYLIIGETMSELEKEELTTVQISKTDFRILRALANYLNMKPKDLLHDMIFCSAKMVLKEDEVCSQKTTIEGELGNE